MTQHPELLFPVSPLPVATDQCVLRHRSTISTHSGTRFHSGSGFSVGARCRRSTPRWSITSTTHGPTSP